MQNQSTFQVYNASAGSGKTFTLVKEYLKILLETADMHRFQYILAVTFTNKAAAEMKTRVIGNLRAFSEVDVLENKSDMFLQIEEETGLQATLIHERSQKILQSILNNYSAFNITTIDSFTHRLIRSFALDLGLSLNFDVEMDTSSLLNEAVDVLISKIGEDRDLTEILIDFSLEKANEDKSWDISYELKEIATILLNENHLLNVQKIKEQPLSAFITLKEKLENTQKDLETEFSNIGQKGIEMIENVGIDHKDFYYGQFPKHFLNLKHDVEKVSFDPSKGLSKSIENDLFYTKNKPDDVKAAIDTISNQLIELHGQSKELYKDYIRNKLFINSLIPLAVLSKISSTLDQLKEEKNIRLNAEFNQLISKNLQEQPAAFIYERIGEKLKYYFIDEMQDTSGLQWSNLIPLIDNALSQENASLLLVGDAKQAIYRWRGGEANQFIQLSSETNTSFEGNPFQISKQHHLLDTNYRSHIQIIDFNNHFFQFISKHFNKQDYARIYKEENKQKRNKKKGGYVQLSFVEERLKAAEKDEVYPKKVLETIRDLEGKFDKNEICVLTRTRKQGVTIANFLSENGIDIISSETLLLKNSLKVNFLIDFLKYSLHQNDKEAKLEVLYFLYDHLEITIDKHEFLADLVHESMSFLSQKLAHYGIYFNYHDFIQLPLYESIEDLIRSFKLTQSSDAYLQFFLDEVLKYAQKNNDGIQGFIELWEQKKDVLSIVVPEGKDAVQIMTIHKSKGLEFPVVIFPYADVDIYREQKTKIWYPTPDNGTFDNFDSLLVNFSKSLEETGPLGKHLYQMKRDELELDNFNLLYVTLTRAIEQLYIISEHKKETDGAKSYAHFFIRYLNFLGRYDREQSDYEFGFKDRVSVKRSVTKKSVELQEFISSSWQDHNINIAMNADLLWNEGKQESIAFGNLIHQILSKVKTVDDVNDAVKQYYLLGFLQKEDILEVERTIHKVVTHPNLSAYFQQNNVVYNEREILTNDREIIIPDRFVINETNEVVLIDYKTGKPEKKYHTQLLKYGETLEQLGFRVKKKLLVFIGETVKIEEV